MSCDDLISSGWMRDETQMVQIQRRGRRLRIGHLERRPASGPCSSLLREVLSSTGNTNRSASGQDRCCSCQSVSMLSSPAVSDSRFACSSIARRKGSTPVPASSDSPNPLTSPPNNPVRRASSKFCTAARNCGELMMRWRTSGEGGVGKSGGR